MKEIVRCEEELKKLDFDWRVEKLMKVSFYDDEKYKTEMILPMKDSFIQDMQKFKTEVIEDSKNNPEKYVLYEKDGKKWWKLKDDHN